jgi:hypothetical protein
MAGARPSLTCPCRLRGRPPLPRSPRSSVDRRDSGNPCSAAVGRCGSGHRRGRSAATSAIERQQFAVPVVAPSPARITEPASRHTLAARGRCGCSARRRAVSIPLPGSPCGAGNGRTIAWTAHDDESSSRDRSLASGRADCRTKESPMSSSMVNFIAIIVRRGGATSLNPC